MVTDNQANSLTQRVASGLDLQFLCPCAVQGSFSWEREEGIKAPTFTFTECSRHFQEITGLILQQPHTAITLISS